MKNNIIRVIAALPGMVMLMNGVGFLMRPEQTVNGLGMELLDGIGRSTQLGDMTAFFIGIAALILFGAFKSEGRWLYAGAMFIGGAAVGRIMAALVADAAMATQFIVPEIIMTVWLCLCAYFLDKGARVNEL